MKLKGNLERMFLGKVLFALKIDCNLQNKSGKFHKDISFGSTDITCKEVFLWAITVHLMRFVLIFLLFN